MGKNRRLVQRTHKLRDDVTDNVPKREKTEKRDIILNDSPGAYAVIRGIKYRLAEDFASDTFQPKIEAAWEINVAIERIDFGGGDFGLRVTIPSSVDDLARGVKALDELRIAEEGSALEAQRYEFIEEANSGDVDAGKVRVIDDTHWRLPDDAGWVDELSVVIRVEIGAGVR